MKHKILRNRITGVLAALTVSICSFSVKSQVNIVEDFSSDPIGTTWTFGFGDNSNSQYSWANTAPAYTGDSNGSLTVLFDSSLPTARLQRNLGQSFDSTQSFTLSTVFSFSVVNAPNDQFMQFAFGLVDSAATGGSRTGNFFTSTPADTFSSIEFNYFPNATAFGGPTLQQVAIGGEAFPGAEIFDNWALGFGAAYDVTLPQATLLQADLIFDSFSQMLDLNLYTVNGDGSLSFFASVPSVNTSALAPSFAFDSMAIMAYFDEYTTPMDPSLVGAMTFQHMSFTTPIPEPGTWLLLSVGLVCLLVCRKKFAVSAKTVAIS
ncbi:PEP-CTERM sorting domain-containing protein [Oscillatoria amoena NRMC-F 0135]|nr:PEP-CTERM sorting domain-containing protein [Oscillatoria amoena NRMC-F 0135]